MSAIFLEDEGMYSNRNQLVDRIKYQRLSYVLDFGFNIFDCVRRFDVEGDGFTSKCFYEDLHVVCSSLKNDRRDLK